MHLGKNTEKEKKPREVLNSKGMNFQNQKILDMNIDRKEFDEDLNFLENKFEKLRKDYDDSQYELKECIRKTMEETAKITAAATSPIIVEKTLEASAKIVDLSAEKFEAKFEVKMQKFACLEKNVEKGLLAEIANLGAKKFGAKLEVQMKKVVNVEKKYGRLRNALLEEWILELISLNDE